MTFHPAPTSSLVTRKSTILLFVFITFLCVVADNASSAGITKGRLTQIYEPSGIEQNGSITLIIEDEKDQPLHLVTGLSRDMSLSTQALQKCETALDDLEGIAADGPFFYLVGSHGQKADGSRRKKREIFVRLKVHGNVCEQIVSGPSLYKEIQAVLSRHTGQSGTPFAINIEALAWKHGSSQIYIGLRQPLIDGKSILLVLENPRDLFDKGGSAVISAEPVLLPLGGGGIRAMSYINELGGYLIANEINDNTGKKRSRLWFWRGGPPSPSPINLADIQKMKNIEGLSLLQHSAQGAVIFVSDDGSRKKNNGAHFAIIPLSVLKKAIER